MDTLALTDRDGTYGAVKFAKACLRAGIRPVLGVDLAYRARPPAPAATGARSPVRGGAYRDLPPDRGGLPRATVPGQRRHPAAGRAGGRRCAGWSRRPTSPASGAAPVGRPTCSRRPTSRRGDVAGAARPRLRARARRPPGAATTSPCDALAPWRELVPRPRTSSSSWSPTGSPARQRRRRPGTSAARRPDGRRRPPGRAGRRSSPTRSATPTGSTPRPSTSSTPPAGWSPSTGATSTAATPRASSSPASRCTRSPRRSAGWPAACRRHRARGPPAAGPRPAPRRPVRPRPARRPRARRGALPGVRALSTAER